MRFLINFIFFMMLMGIVIVAAGIYYLLPGLPATDSLQNVQFSVPLRVYTHEGSLMSEFGEKRRLPVEYDDVPEVMVDAFLASEDDRFFEHPGVDWQGIARAVVLLVQTGERAQGGSTITMQVARNFFLTPEKTYTRKLNEILLALKIESEFDKETILELYFNKIYLGHRAYGIVAASELYYGAPLSELTLAQTAMMAGLPKAPSRMNPVTNPERALQRRNYVLGRMVGLGDISDEEYQVAVKAPVTARIHHKIPDTSSPYVAEMVRSYMVEKYADKAYTSGYKVYTTIRDHLQIAADKALRDALINYDKRHGYRGAEHHYDLEQGTGEGDWIQMLEGYPALGGLIPALVISVADKTAEIYLKNEGLVTLEWEGMVWARRYIDENRREGKPKSVIELFQSGDLIRIRKTDEGLKLAQIPDVEGALVSLSPEDGSILALSGGFDFNRSKFNRVVQAHRQPGSSFKPIIYSAALANGYTAASLVNDAPVVFDDPGLEDTWRPENYSGKYRGPTRLRSALTYSRNLISIRLLRSVGIKTAIKHASKFGFDTERLPKDLSLSLGSGAVSPLELARAYTLLANGGYLTTPYFINRIETAKGDVVFQANPDRVCRDCGILEGESADGIATKVVDSRNTFIVASMMRDVIRAGTGKRALVLSRNDLSGKTGTTNDQKDAWFSGFNANIVTTAWVGFDQIRPLGSSETGGQAALPMWIDYMRVALDGMPEALPAKPSGIITMNVDKQTGLLATTGQKGSYMEIFRKENAPTRMSVGDDPESGQTETGIPEQLF